MPSIRARVFAYSQSSSSKVSKSAWICHASESVCFLTGYTAVPSGQNKEVGSLSTPTHTHTHSWRPRWHWQSFHNRMCVLKIGERLRRYTQQFTREPIPWFPLLPVGHTLHTDVHTPVIASAQTTKLHLRVHYKQKWFWPSCTAFYRILLTDCSFPWSDYSLR